MCPSNCNLLLLSISHFFIVRGEVFGDGADKAELIQVRKELDSNPRLYNPIKE
jgi:hypothetical protein